MVKERKGRGGGRDLHEGVRREKFCVVWLLQGGNGASEEIPREESQLDTKHDVARWGMTPIEGNQAKPVYHKPNMVWLSRSELDAALHNTCWGKSTG